MCTKMFITALFLITPSGNNPNVFNSGMDEHIVVVSYKRILFCN